MRKRKKRPLPTLVNDDHMPEVKKHILSSNAQQMADFITDLNEKNKSGRELSIIIDTVQDNDYDDIKYPIHKSALISSKYHMHFQNTRKILYDPKNKLTYLDIYVFHYLCEMFADYKRFYVNQVFWEDIKNDMEGIGVNFNINSIHNSLSRLKKATIILSIGKGCYTLNKILVFSGDLNTREEAIKNDFSPLKSIKQ